MVTPKTIEVFADVWCPFTHVGLQMLVDRRDSLGRADVKIVVRSWPLELINGTPMQAEKTRTNCAALRAHVAPTMFGNVDFDNFPMSTLDALDLVAQAYVQDVSLGERASLAIRRALFEEGRDISDHAVLSALASDVGASYVPDSGHRLVMRDYEAGKTRGVIGSPHFFCGPRDMFCPSLDISRDENQQMVVSVDTTGLSTFIHECLDG